MILSLIFGHYWGIDEVGVFVVPVVLFLAIMRWANDRRPESEPTAGDDGDVLLKGHSDPLKSRPDE